MNRALQHAFAALCLFLYAVPAPASTSDCGLIKDETARRICYARNSHRESDCGLIQDRDSERLCRALSKR